MFLVFLLLASLSCLAENPANKICGEMELFPATSNLVLIKMLSKTLAAVTFAVAGVAVSAQENKPSE